MSNCIYCKKEFSDKSTLVRHQKTAKFCLKLQKEQNNTDITVVTYKCEFCNKELTSNYNLNYHLNICKEKFKVEKQVEKQADKNIEEMKEEMEKIKQEMEKLKNSNLSSTTNNTNSNNTINNTINISIFSYMTPERVADTFKEKYSKEIFLECEKGLADFTLDNFLMGKDKPLYLCTDRSRNQFKCVDLEGKLIEDPNADMLASMTSNGFEKVNKLYKDEIDIIDGAIKENSRLKSNLVFELLDDKNKIIDTYNKIINVKKNGEVYRNRLSKKLPKSIEQRDIINSNKIEDKNDLKEKSDVIKEPDMDKSEESKKIITKQVIEDMINSIKYESSSEEDDSSSEEEEEQEEEKQEEDETSSEEEYIFEKSLVPVWQMRQIKEYYEQNNRIAIPTKYNTKECIECIKKYVYGK